MVQEKLTLARIHHESGKKAFASMYLLFAAYGFLFITGSLCGVFFFDVDVMENSLFQFFLFGVTPIMMVGLLAAYPFGRLSKKLQIRYLRQEIENWCHLKNVMLHLKDKAIHEQDHEKTKIIEKLQAIFIRQLTESHAQKEKNVAEGKIILQEAYIQNEEMGKEIEEEDIPEARIALLNLQVIHKEAIENFENTICDMINGVKLAQQKIITSYHNAKNKIETQYELVVSERKKKYKAAAEKYERKAKETELFLKENYL